MCVCVNNLPIDSSLDFSSLNGRRTSIGRAACGDGLPGFAPKGSWTPKKNDALCGCWWPLKKVETYFLMWEEITGSLHIF